MGLNQFTDRQLELLLQAVKMEMKTGSLESTDYLALLDVKKCLEREQQAR